MINKVDSFNDAVYNDWCARGITELLDLGFTKNELIDIFNDVLNDSEDIHVIDPEENLKRMLRAGIRLSEEAMGEINKI